jgi:tRNA(fMet)-specific endonuclease VapC
MHFLLDTDTVGYLVRGRSMQARGRLVEALREGLIAISAVTEGELRYGLAKRPDAVRLKTALEEFISACLVLPWDSKAARAYGALRERLLAAGKSLSALDMLTAAHALAENAVLVTRDEAFAQPEAAVATVNWATDI